jgi:hypothetical protein
MQQCGVPLQQNARLCNCRTPTGHPADVSARQEHNALLVQPTRGYVTLQAHCSRIAGGHPCWEWLSGGRDQGPASQAGGVDVGRVPYMQQHTDCLL